MTNICYAFQTTAELAQIDTIMILGK